jgi:hypothetical protein
MLFASSIILGWKDFWLQNLTVDIPFLYLFISFYPTLDTKNIIYNSALERFLVAKPNCIYSLPCILLFHFKPSQSPTINSGMSVLINPLLFTLRTSAMIRAIEYPKGLPLLGLQGICLTVWQMLYRATTYVPPRGQPGRQLSHSHPGSFWPDNLRVMSTLLILIYHRLISHYLPVIKLLSRIQSSAATTYVHSPAG